LPRREPRGPICGIVHRGGHFRPASVGYISNRIDIMYQTMNDILYPIMKMIAIWLDVLGAGEISVKGDNHRCGVSARQVATDTGQSRPWRPVQRRKPKRRLRFSAADPANDGILGSNVRPAGRNDQIWAGMRMVRHRACDKGSSCLSRAVHQDVIGQGKLGGLRYKPAGVDGGVRRGR